MLDLKYTRDHLEEVREKIGRRGQAIDWDGFSQLDSERREILQQSESLRAQRNQVSDLIAEKKKKKLDANEEIARMLEKPVGAVKALQHRALNTLRRILSFEERVP